ncbi:MAG TPA: hypothetical protein VFN97_01730 [Actinospica sp.]|nr:hypothetical protein [Actinospica sp.]
MRTHHGRRLPRQTHLAAGFAVIGAFAVVGASLVFLPSQGANADPATLCGGQQASVSAGRYIVQNNEYNSGANECVTSDGSADFTVANSDMTTPPGAPGGYPSIYAGCHWGSCTAGGLAANPIQVANLTAGQVTTSWSTTQPTGPGDIYDVAYDIWFNHAATTHAAPDCAEVMVWLGHRGAPQPYGTNVASKVTLGGIDYTVWEGVQTIEPTISYEMTTPATSVTAMDLYPIARDAVSRGYISDSCYLIAVEAGFELWNGGAGLATNSFSVEVGGAPTGTPTPSTSTSQSPTTGPAPSPTSSPTASASGTPAPGPTPTASSTPTSSPTPSPTATAAPTPSPTSTPSPTHSPAPTPTPGPTLSPTPTLTPGPRPTGSGSPRQTPLLSSSA